MMFKKESLYQADVQMRPATKSITAASGANLDGMSCVFSPLYQIGSDDAPNLAPYAGEWAMGLRSPLHETISILPSGDLANFVELGPEAREEYPLMDQATAQRLGSYIPAANREDPFAGGSAPTQSMPYDGLGYSGL